MLTSSLVRVRVQGKSIRPALVDITSGRHLARAEELLDVFAEAQAARWTRAKVEQTTREVEGNEADHKFVRGLTKLLLDQCSFETRCPVAPGELRMAAFLRAAARGPLARRAGPAERATATDVLREVVAEAGAVPDPDSDPGTGLYADLKGEQILAGRKGPETPRALLERYNVALVQAILLKAESMTLHLDAPDPKRVRQLFRFLKFFQLMYRARLDAGTLTLHLDGPQSLLTASTRYGLQLATFLPAVLLQTGAWALEAEIRWGKRRLRKQLILDDTAGLASHYKDTGVWTSRTETWFRERWERTDTDGWVLGPGTLIELGDQRVLVPDFTLRKQGRIAHLDIVGYWRGRWLKQHMDGTPDHVLVAASRRLVGEKKGGIPKRLDGRCIPFAEV
ncbi:MAG: DUF790 family protein, partial [Myxococcota bacterium]|nr:DUF790 family protein [Myxococcota bacterium]